MMGYFKYSITNSASISDCTMILDELKHDLKNVGVNQAQLNEIMTIIGLKKNEVDSRF